jgi:predicted transcriptional regulator
MIQTPEVKDDKEAIDSDTIDRALLRVIRKRGSQCLSQASLRTGFGIAALSEAKDRLIERGFIRIREGSSARSAAQVSYELNV